MMVGERGQNTKRRKKIMKKIATKIERKLDTFTGDAALFSVDPPMEDCRWNDDDERETIKYNYVVVSATIAPYSGAETYIFGADAEGKVLSWSELDGSYRGGLDHEEALRNAGYQIAQTSTQKAVKAAKDFEVRFKSLDVTDKE
jgi:hypothetical protein